MVNKTIDERSDYQKEKDNNEWIFKNMLKDIRPELYVLMDLLDTTGISPLIVFKILRQLNNIAMGTKYGNVVIEVQNGVVTFIRGEESDRVNESIVKKENSY
jgi:hypothetical protein